MGWVQDTYKKLSGASLKTDVGKLGQRYDDEYSDVTAGYDKLSSYASGMMNPMSSQNLRMKSLMSDDLSDNVAEQSRLAGRNIAMGGGGNATSTAFNAADAQNNATADTLKSFNTYLQGNMNQGAGMLSGVLANQGQIAGNKFNMLENQRQTNKQLDAASAQYGMNLFSQGAQMVAGIPPVGMAHGGEVEGAYGGRPDSSQQLNQDAMHHEGSPFPSLNDEAQIVSRIVSSGMQEGGEVGPGMLSQVMGPNGPVGIKTRMGGETIG